MTPKAREQAWRVGDVMASRATKLQEGKRARGTQKTEAAKQ